MQVWLIRHTESTKNRDGEQFGGAQVNAGLTAEGSQAAESLAQRLPSLGSVEARPAVWTSPERRARDCAVALGRGLGGRVTQEPRFRGIDGGTNAGKSEVEVERDDPVFWQALQLYRSGVLSAYDVPTRGESIRDLERRVGDALEEVEASGVHTGMIVAHRSALTAAIIRYARKLHAYPVEFYGYVELPLASITIIETEGPAAGIRQIASDVPRV